MTCGGIVHKRQFDSLGNWSPSLPEECTQQSGRFCLAYPGEDIRPMMAGRLAEDPGSMHHAAALRIVRAESDCRDPSQSHGGRTHRARFKRDPKRATVQPRLAKAFGGAPDRNNLRMGGGIEAPAHGVARLSDNLLALGDDGSNRHFTSLGGFACKVQRTAHGRRKRKAHGTSG